MNFMYIHWLIRDELFLNKVDNSIFKVHWIVMKKQIDFIIIMHFYFPI